MKPHSSMEDDMLGMRPWIVPIIVVALLGALACGAGEEEGFWGGTDEAEFTSAPAQPAMAMADATCAEGR